VISNRITLLPVATLAVLATTGFSVFAAPGPQQTQDRPIAAVTGVQLETWGRLSITPGDTARLTVTACSTVIDRLTSEVEDGILVLGTDGPISTPCAVRYDLVLPWLDSLVVDGSGDAIVRSVPTDDLSITDNGSGGVEVSGLRADELDVHMTGSGDVEVEGSATMQDALVEGSGSYDAITLDSRQATVTVSGSGNADVRVTKTLTAVVTGSGSIGYTGGAHVTRRVEGSGEVFHR
jgi:Putative auto-transporter adhesin, head GIN domain